MTLYMIKTFLFPQMSNNIWYLSFCFWSVSFSIIHSFISNHVITINRIFLFSLRLSSIYYENVPLLTFLSFNRHLKISYKAQHQTWKYRETSLWCTDLCNLVCVHVCVCASTPVCVVGLLDYLIVLFWYSDSEDLPHYFLKHTPTNVHSHVSCFLSGTSSLVFIVY